MVPRHSAVASRYDVDLATHDGTGATLPLVVANMTAIAGKRMAETTARRGGLTVIPQDIPIPVVTDVVQWVKQRHLVFDTPIELAPTQTVAEALSLIPKRSHHAAVVVEDGRPVGVVSEADCAEVDRFAQVGAVMRRDLVTVAADADPRVVFDRLDAAKAPLAVAVGEDGSLVGVLTRLGALRATLYTPAVDASGGLRVAAAVGVNGEVAARAGRPAGRRRRLPRRGHRPRAPGPDARGAPRGAGALAGGADRGGQRGLRRGHPRAGRGGRRHRQGRRRPGRHVHHPDDDRRRAPAVQRGARVRGRCSRARQARVGRRGSAAPARRRARPGRRRQLGDDRLVVRRDARVARRPHARRRRAGLQGVLRDGLGAGRRPPHVDRVGVRPGPQGPLRGGHLLVADVPRAGPARASRTSSTRSAPGCGRPARTPAPRRSRSSTSARSSACSRPPASTRDGR